MILKKVKVISVILITGMLSLAGSMQFIGKGNDSNVKKRVVCNKKILKLNEIGNNADDTVVESVKVNKKDESVFGESRKAYEVEGVEYSDKDIRKIAKELDTKVDNKEKLDNSQVYDLKDDGVLMYYSESGAITYISDENNVDNVAEDKKINKEKCIKVAQDFLKSSDIIPYSDVHLANVEVGYTAETSDGIVPLTYQITYMKNAPDGVDGFVGVGPGICIDVDSNYEITAFTSINKDIHEISNEYSTLTTEEVMENIEGGVETQVLIDSESGVENESQKVNLNNVKVCLYCDSAGVDQQYMAPYYVMEGENEEGEDVAITTLALKDDDYKLK